MRLQSGKTTMWYIYYETSGQDSSKKKEWKKERKIKQRKRINLWVKNIAGHFSSQKES